MTHGQQRQRILNAAAERHASYKAFHDVAMRLGEAHGMALLSFSYCHTLASSTKDAERMRARIEDKVNAVNPAHTPAILSAMDAYRDAFIAWEREIAAVMAP